MPRSTWRAKTMTTQTATRAPIIMADRRRVRPAMASDERSAGARPPPRSATSSAVSADAASTPSRSSSSGMGAGGRRSIRARVANPGFGVNRACRDSGGGTAARDRPARLPRIRTSVRNEDGHANLRPGRRGRRPRRPARRAVAGPGGRPPRGHPRPCRPSTAPSPTGWIPGSWAGWRPAASSAPIATRPRRSRRSTRATTSSWSRRRRRARPSATRSRSSRPSPTTHRRGRCSSSRPRRSARTR